MKVIIYGCCYEAEKFIKVNKSVEILYCVEDNLNIHEFQGYPVYKSDKLREHPNGLILIFTRNVLIYQRISSILKTWGMCEFDDYLPAHLFGKKLALIWGNCHAVYLKIFLSYSKEFSKEYAFYDTKNLWDMKESDIDENLFGHCDLLVCQQIREENKLGRYISSDRVEKFLKSGCKILRFPNLFGLPKFLFPQTSLDHIYMTNHGTCRWYRDIYIDEEMKSNLPLVMDNIIDRLNSREIDIQTLDKELDIFWEKVRIREEQSNIHIIDYLQEHFNDTQLFLDIEHPSKMVLNEIGNRMLEHLGMSRLPGQLRIDNTYGHEVPIYPQVKNHFHMTWKDGDIKADNKNEKINVVYMDFPEYVKQYIDVYMKNKNLVSYSCYIENRKNDFLGTWIDVNQRDNFCGSVGKSLKLFAIKVESLIPNEFGVKYKICGAKSGWTEWKFNGEVAGNTMDVDDYITSINIGLIGQNRDNLYIKYRVHSQNVGWMPFVGAGQEAGMVEKKYRVEAIQVIIEKSEKTKNSQNSGGGIENADNRLQDLRDTLFHRDIEKYNKSAFLSVGDFTYGVPSIRFNRNENESVTIGKFCSIAAGVKIFGGGEHNSKWMTTYPFCVFLKEYSGIEGYPAYRPSRTKIDNDVWIGEDAKILNGVHISDGAIIGTAAVVTKDVPPYAIVAGNPARIIRYRFEPDVIDKLLEMKWWEWSDSQIYAAVRLLESENIEELYQYYLCFVKNT